MVQKDIDDRQETKKNRLSKIQSRNPVFGLHMLSGIRFNRTCSLGRTYVDRHTGVAARDMSGVTAVVSIIALFVSIAALWLTTETIKKVESRTQRLLTTHITGLKDNISQINQIIKSLHAGFEKLDKQSTGVSNNQNATEKKLNELKREVEVLSQTLESLNTTGASKSRSRSQSSSISGSRNVQ